jgi:hypothetical protein
MIIQPGLCKIEGFRQDTRPKTGEVLVDKKNAIHYENISLAMAQTSERSQHRDTSMKWHLATAEVQLIPLALSHICPQIPQVKMLTCTIKLTLKLSDDNSAADTDPENNRMTPLHTSGNVYSDILVTCLLDYGEPPEQQAFDNSTNFNGEFVFDELGLKTWNGSVDNLRLITHVIFHPVQKSLNRQIQIDYTLRIQTLSNINAV